MAACRGLEAAAWSSISQVVAEVHDPESLELLEELLERHDGTEAHLLPAVRSVAAAATAPMPEQRPGFSALLHMLSEKRKGRELRRPRSNFGRVY